MEKCRANLIQQPRFPAENLVSFVGNFQFGQIFFPPGCEDNNTKPAWLVLLLQLVVPLLLVAVPLLALAVPLLALPVVFPIHQGDLKTLRNSRHDWF